MVISDKQELRRCVKQAVRRAGVCEADLSFDAASGEMGILAMMDVWARPAGSPSEALRRSCADQTPFCEDAAAMFAALDALDFPVNDLDRALAMERSYDRNTYLREVLDAMRAKYVLVRVPVHSAAQALLDEERFSVLLEAEEDLFVPGRYGIDYAGAARKIADAVHACGAQNLSVRGFDEQKLRYCILPVCQDEGLALHISLNTCEEVQRFAQLLDVFDGVFALVSVPDNVQRCLIDEAAQRVRMMVRLTGIQALGYALEKLGTARVVPYAACAALPEIMLGRWINAKEQIWQALSELYLPLARSGYELQSAAIERDVNRLLNGNLLALCRRETV